jgi:MGT family glycosyltransferase
MAAPTVVFFPEGAFGPTNNCVGIGDVLRRRGARVVFVVEESFAGTLEAKGFEERLMRLGPAPEVEEAPGQFWKDFVRETSPVLRQPTIEQIEGFLRPTWQALCDGSRYVDERLAEILDEVQPDVIVEDNVVAFPAIAASGRPWVRIVSCNPLEVRDPDLPPTFSGYPTEDRTGWADFAAEYERVMGPVQAEFADWVAAAGAPPLPWPELMHESPYLNLTLYPAEADYRRRLPLPPTWHQLDSCVRATDEPWAVPDSLAGDAPLLYLSLGSLGSADAGLMQRLIDALGRAPWRVIVSLGPQHEELRLFPNMTGAEFLPQTSILPQVDLVITHGGNNTTTECFHFGKPMLVLPLFWDQHDNAQRVHELGFGLRLPSYEWTEEELAGAIERLLGDAALRARLEATSARLQRRPGTETAAELIERVAGR